MKKEPINLVAVFNEHRTYEYWSTNEYTAETTFKHWEDEVIRGLEEQKFPAYSLGAIEWLPIPEEVQRKRVFNESIEKEIQEQREYLLRRLGAPRDDHEANLAARNLGALDDGRRLEL